MSDNLLRKIVSEIKEYKPGKNPEKPGMIKLASNENPFGPSPKALKAIEEESKNLQMYPDQKSTKLRQALADNLFIPEENIIVGNGSDDLMQILAGTFLSPSEEVIISKNSFSVYELVARIFEGKIVWISLENDEIDLSAIAEAITDKTKIIFLTNPNNPTGAIFNAKSFDEFIKKIPQNVLVVVDEAYKEFVESQEFPDTIKYIRDGQKNLIVLRTFSKYYGLAGLRVGYGIAAPELISAMMKVKMPFNVSKLAQVGASAALKDFEFLNKTYKNNIEGKNFLYAELDKLGLAYKKTESNFIFIDLKKDCYPIFLQLMAEGVIVRPLRSFGFPQAIRVSVGTLEQNKIFIDTLNKILS